MIADIKLTQKCIYGTMLIVHLWEYLPTGVRQILHQCLHGDISAISQLYSRSCYQTSTFHSNFRNTFHLFLEYGELPALPILQITVNIHLNVPYMFQIEKEKNMFLFICLYTVFVDELLTV